MNFRYVLVIKDTMGTVEDREVGLHNSHDARELAKLITKASTTTECATYDTTVGAIGSASALIYTMRGTHAS